MSRGPVTLVGRGREVEAIEEALRAAESGPARALLLAGEPGIGKTRLLGELRDRARRRGTLTLTGRATEFERELPFGLFVDALDDHLAAADRATQRSLDPRMLADLAGILPSSAVRRRNRDASLREERYRSHRALRSLLRALCGSGPLVLVLDDVHWADPASAEAVSYLLRHPVDAPLLLAMAFREASCSPALAAALVVAVKDGHVVRLDVAPLGLDDAHTLLGPDLDPQVRARLHRDCGGNPFYLLEMSRATPARPGRRAGADGGDRADPVPPSVRSAVGAELDALTSSTRQLLDGAAVVGDPFRLDLAAVAAGLSWEDALGAVDDLQSRDLVRPTTDDAGQFRFRHPIVRRAAYQASGAGWRLGAHTRVAATLAEWGSPPAALAHHVEPSARPGDEDAIRLLTNAGRDVAADAPATAARWFRAALRLVPQSTAEVPRRRELLLSMADALRTAGRLDESRDRFRDALQLVAPDDVPTRVPVVVACAGLEFLLRRHAEALDLLRRTLAGLPDQHSPQAASLRLAMGGTLVWGVDKAAPGGWARRALDDAQRLADPPLQAAALGLLATGEWRLGDTDATREAIRTARTVLDGLTDDALASRIEALTWLGWAEGLSERAEDAIHDCERGLAIARSTGQGHLLTPLLTGLGYALQWRGQLSAALECYDDAAEIALLTATKETHALAVGLRGAAATVRGDLAGALRHGRQALEIAGDGDDLPVLVGGLFLAETLLEAGDPRGCIEQLLAAGGGASLARGERPYLPFWYEILTRAELALRHVDAAETWARRAEEHAADLGLPGRAGWAQRARAAVLLAQGDATAAVTLARSSAGLLDQAGNPIEQARSRILTGRALAATGETPEAIAELTAAEAELARCGADGYRQQAARELRRLGRRAPRPPAGRPAGGGLPALSAREREIADHVRDGRTNREIAATLYLSEKTIERHLTNIFTKIGVPSRAALASAVTREAERLRRKPEQEVE